MNKLSKKVITIICAVCMTASVATLSGCGNSDSASSGNGASTDVSKAGNVSWSYDENDKILTISGNGKMDDYATGSEFPWHGCSESATSVVVEDGVTSIGKNAFFNFSKLESIKIPDSLESIGDSAFVKCESLAEISIPDSVKEIGASAFMCCTSFKSVTLP